MPKGVKVLFICLIFIFSVVRLQGNNLKFYHLNNSDGLSQNTIYFIHQDQKGLFWFGTDGGLNRWNGYDFTVYGYSKDDSTTLGQGRVNCMFEDSNGDLWIGTYQGGMSKFNRASNNFNRFTLKGIYNQERVINNFTQIDQWNGILVIGTFGDGLYLFDKQKLTFMPVQLFDDQMRQLKDLSITKIHIDCDSTIWVGHTQGVLMIKKNQIDLKKARMVCKEYLKGENVLSIYRDKQNRVWFGTHQSGGFYLSILKNELKKMTEEPELNLCDYTNMRDIREDKDGNLWFATGGNGISIMDRERHFIKHYISELNNFYSLSSDITYCLFLDKNQNMWVGTYNAGLNYTNNHKQSFNHIRGYGGKGELNNNAILSLCEMNDGKIMVGTDGGGINIFDRNEGIFSPLLAFNNHNKSIKSVPVSIVHDNQGNYYIGTYLKGLYIYNENTRQLKNFRAGKDKYSLQSDEIWSIAVSKTNEIWLGTLGKGVMRFEPESGRFFNYFDSLQNFNLSPQYVFSLLFDKENNLWVGTQNNGLVVLDNKHRKLKKHYKKNGIEGLTSNEIWEIFEDSKGTIWVATHDGGICIFDASTETFKALSINDGLNTNTTKSIIEDVNGNIWVGTNSGLSRITANDSRFAIINYTQQNGLQSNEFSTNANLITADGTLFFGGNNGFNFFKPDEIVADNKVGPVIITDVAVLYHTDHNGKTKSVIHTLDTINNSIYLNYNLSLVSINFAMLDYTIPELNTYEYKLDGFDQNWINAGNNRLATYTNLAPGNYHFYVKGTNSLNITNPQPASINIVIKPPFWRSLWFKTIGICFIVLSIILMYRLRLRRFRIQERKLRETVENRTKELLLLNKLLAERNNEIKIQSEELKTKSEHLIQVNSNLEESHAHIELQNIELEKHRHHLEVLVEERTRQLELSKLKAEESERLKMAFLANMSHEIRTPMNAILGFSSLLTSDDYTDAERKNFIQLINSNGNNLLLLIDDILDLSRIEANQLVIIKKQIKFAKVFEEIVANWQVIQKERNDEVKFEFEYRVNEKDLIITSDESRIKQIINNLIDNAFKFTCLGSVKLIASIVDEKVLICIKDTGMGIGKDSLPYIFERFRKSEESNNKNYRGAGLGLTISKKLAHLLDGDLWVESVFGQGSEFYLELPIQNSYDN